MKVTLYMAMSVNGMIARKDGSEDFLSNENWKTFVSLAEEHGNFIVGRKTYDAVKAWDEDFGFDDLLDIEKIIVSSDPGQKLDVGYTPALSPQDALETLSKRGLKNALVTGGSALNSSFAEDGLLDEIILNVDPVFIGSGKNVFADADFDLEATLVSSKTTNGILTLKYKVRK